MKKMQKLFALLLAGWMLLAAVPPAYAAAPGTAAKTQTAAAASALAAPKLLSVKNTASGIAFTWQKVPGAEKYRVYFKTGNGDWKKIGDTEKTSYTRKDKNLQPGTKYTFTVRAVDGNGKLSGYDQAGKAVTYVRPASVTKVEGSNAGVTISWNKSAGAAKYRVYYKMTGGWKKIGETTKTSYKWKDAKIETKYKFTVKALAKDGSAASYDSGKSMTLLSAPENIQAKKTSATTAKISWTKVSGAAKYRVFYRTDSGSWKKLGDTTGTSYTWKKAKSGKTYRFTVRCITKDGSAYTGGYDTEGAGAVLALKEISRYSYFKKYMNDNQLQKAYDEAMKIVAPLQGLSRREQVEGVTLAVYRIWCGISYSMELPHYDDPYGLLILNTASCAGSVRTTGLCFDMLGIPYEHMHEHEYGHQWARVKIGGEYWVSDANIGFAAPESFYPLS